MYINGPLLLKTFLFRSALGPHLVRGKCPNCTPFMHKQANRILKHTAQNYPDEYKKIYQIYAGKSSKPASSGR